MGEIYTGPKFKTQFISDLIPAHDNCTELITWCHKIAELGMAPAGGKAGNAGNMSFRTSNGFIITGAGTDLSIISDEQLVEVTDVDPKNNLILASGILNPSSESFLHHAFYQANEDIFAVFHGHYDDFFKKKELLKIPETDKEIEYGTADLGRSAVSILSLSNFLLLKNHGFVSVGNSMEEAGKTLITTLERSRDLDIAKTR